MAEAPVDSPPIAGVSPACTPAQVAELVDALASGASVCIDVEVRVLSWAPIPLLIAVHNRSKPLIFKEFCVLSVHIAEHSIPPFHI